MSKRNTYSPDLKVQVAEEYLDGNTSYRILIKKYDIPDTKTVREWVKLYNKFGKDYFYETHRKHSKKLEDIDFEDMTIEEQNYYLMRENAILKKAKALNLI